MSTGFLFLGLGKKTFFSTLFLAALVTGICCTTSIDRSSASRSSAPKKDSFTEVTIMFAGDVMEHLPQIKCARVDSTDGYDFGPVFQYIAPIIKKSDIAVANLETTFGGKPYSGYPQFSAPDTLAWFLKRAGFNLILDANNHAADKNTKGILGTIDGLNRAGLGHTGTFKDSADRAKTYPYIAEKKGVKLAFLNYTFSTNGIPVIPPVIVNYIDTAQIKLDVETARKKKADAIIVVFHWGIEYQRMPNEEQQRIANFCLAHGIDIVIGSHPHVVQPAFWETFRRPGDTIDRKGLVLYSLGNFVSSQVDRFKDGGIIFSITLRKNRFSKAVSVANTSFVPTWVYIKPSPKTYYILPANTFECDSVFVASPAARLQRLQSYTDTRGHMLKDSIQWLHEIK
jgi:hypothetical protein